jgi:hypothetical protein
LTNGREVETSRPATHWQASINNRGTRQIANLREPDRGMVEEKVIDYHLVSRLSVAYLLAIITEVMRARQADPMDILISAAVFNGNGEARRGVSRNAVHKMLNIPLETVRRRVKALIERKALFEREDGLVFSCSDALDQGQYSPLLALNLQLLRQFFRDLKARGIELE